MCAVLSDACRRVMLAVSIGGETFPESTENMTTLSLLLRH